LKSSSLHRNKCTSRRRWTSSRGDPIKLHPALKDGTDSSLRRVPALATQQDSNNSESRCDTTTPSLLNHFVLAAKLTSNPDLSRRAGVCRTADGDEARDDRRWLRLRPRPSFLRGEMRGAQTLQSPSTPSVGMPHQGIFSKTCPGLETFSMPPPLISLCLYCTTYLYSYMDGRMDMLEVRTIIALGANDNCI